MSDVDPYFLYTPIPQRLTDDPEIAPWIEAMQRFLLDVWNRTGGGEDAISAANEGVAAQSVEISSLDGTVGGLETALTALQGTVNAIATGTPDYTVSNGSVLRTIDCDAAAGAITNPPTQAEVENIRDAVLSIADVLGTLLDDLAVKGVTG